jgi:hypothetical protein
MLFLGGLLTPVVRTVGAEETFDRIVSNIFLGQAYPSGKIYLESVPLPNSNQSVDDYRAKFHWADSISFHALSSADPGSAQARQAKFSNVLHDDRVDLGSNTFQLKSIDIPEVESMKDGFDSATDKIKESKNPEFQYLGGEYFCSSNPNEGIGVYKTVGLKKVSFSVIAFSKELALSDITHPNRRRPMTPAEAASVKKDKEEEKTHQDDCPTVPAYIDEAVVLLSAKIINSPWSIRISNYDNAGCGGHLASIYLIEFMKDGDVVKTYTFDRYCGAI